LKDVSTKFVDDHYDIDHNEKMNPFEYVVRVNKIKYKGNPIFIVKFLPWNNASKTIFSISYRKEGMTCLAVENS